MVGDVDVEHVGRPVKCPSRLAVRGIGYNARPCWFSGLVPGGWPGQQKARRSFSTFFYFFVALSNLRGTKTGGVVQVGNKWRCCPSAAAGQGGNKQGIEADPSRKGKRRWRLLRSLEYLGR